MVTDTPKRRLLLTDMPVTVDFSDLYKGPEKLHLDVLPIQHDHRYPSSSETVSYHQPSLFIWHDSEGRKAHRQLEKIVSQRVV